jgi:squalene cyclase
MGSRLSTLDQAIAAGLDYILTLQSADGSWTDWDLPPGSSPSWTTGYIGYKLRYLPQHLKLKAAPHLIAGSQWLLLNQFTDGGWGYNRAVGTDADTTSFAILFLASSGQQVPVAAYTILAHYQSPDGGFSTYLPEGESNSWAVSHPDVTPLALLALLTQPTPDRHALDHGLEYVLRQKNPDGLWNSFWWDSFLYGTEASLSFLRAHGTAIAAPSGLSLVQPANAFEGALLISSMLYIDPSGFRKTIRDLADKLKTEQQPDGSWKTAPILRITRRDCFEPWASGNPGPLFADPHRLFTTSTVLHALSRSNPT